jgi:hypothetical protein
MCLCLSSFIFSNQTSPTARKQEVPLVVTNKQLLTVEDEAFQSLAPRTEAWLGLLLTIPVEVFGTTSRPCFISLSSENYGISHARLALTSTSLDSSQQWVYSITPNYDQPVVFSFCQKRDSASSTLIETRSTFVIARDAHHEALTRCANLARFSLLAAADGSHAFADRHRL